MNEGAAAFFGAVIGSGLIVFKEWISSLYATRRRAVYLAIRVVIGLDRFVDECARVAIDDGYLEGNSDEADVTTERPTVPTYPDDLDWRSINHKLAFDILSLPNLVNDAEGSIAAASNYSSPPDHDEYFRYRRREYAKLGLLAVRVGRELRDTHDLPRRLFGEWDPEKVLARELAKIEKLETSYRETTDEMI